MTGEVPGRAQGGDPARPRGLRPRGLLVAFVAILLAPVVASLVLAITKRTRSVVAIRNDSGDVLHDVRAEVLNYVEDGTSEVVVEERAALAPGEVLRIERRAQYDLVLTGLRFQRGGLVHDTGKRHIHQSRMDGTSRLVVIGATGAVTVTAEPAAPSR
ncbi:MAG: hypothetical protein KF878_18485 [Planctomycetes bacterium]|nr:hypothetical protein [Planctomycetota bacterium]